MICFVTDIFWKNRSFFFWFKRKNILFKLLFELFNMLENWFLILLKKKVVFESSNYTIVVRLLLIGI